MASLKATQGSSCVVQQDMTRKPGPSGKNGGIKQYTENLQNYMAIFKEEYNTLSNSVVSHTLLQLRNTLLQLKLNKIGEKGKRVDIKKESTYPMIALAKMIRDALQLTEDELSRFSTKNGVGILTKIRDFIEKIETFVDNYLEPVPTDYILPLMEVIQEQWEKLYIYLKVEAAYREACGYGTTTSYRAKLDIIGHTGVGKTSLCRGFMGQPFMEQSQSTEGIEIHCVKSKFNPQNFSTGMWIEATSNAKEPSITLNKEILSPVTQINPSPVISNPEPKVDEQHREVNSAADAVLETIVQEIIKTDEGFKSNAKLPVETKNEICIQQNKEAYTTDIDYSLRIWDYGGHTEFLATHHLFLSIESTILILLDISKGFKDPIDTNKNTSTAAGIPNTQEQFLHYWLRTIHSQATEKQLDPNVALVLTHSKLVRSEYCQQYFSEINASLADKPYCKYFEKTFFMDNKSSETGFRKLRSHVFKLLAKQRTWGMERPTRWLRLEADILQKAKQESSPFLSLFDVQTIGQLYGVDKNELNTFLDFHHSLGDLVYYKAHGLGNMVITDPQWLADMFRTLVTPQEFIQQRNLDPLLCEQLKLGKIGFNDLQSLWPTDAVRFLIQLFESFNLLLEIRNQAEPQFIVPCMLPPMDNNMYESEPFNNMLLAYNSEHCNKTGEVLPVGTFHKLLSECSKTKDWKICSDDHLSYTDASFEIADSTRLALTLLSKGCKIRASIWCSRDVVDDHLLTFLLQTSQSLDQKLEKFAIKPRSSFLLLCPFCKAEDADTCLVKVSEVMDQVTGEYKIQSNNDRCFMHGRELDAIHFPEPRTDKDRSEESETITQPNQIPSLKLLVMSTTGDIPLEETWGHCPITMVKNHKRYFGTVCNGQARILQAPGSDAFLEIPSGSRGVYKMSVQTNHSGYAGILRKEHCIVSPVVEVVHRPFEDQVTQSNIHVLNIPHCLREEHLLKLMRVKKGDTERRFPFREIPRRGESAAGEDNFSADLTHVRIKCETFSIFICTTCQRTCESTVKTFFFTNLSRWLSRSITTLQVKAFMCSYLFRIAEYREELIKVLRQQELYFTTEDDLNINVKEFNAAQSKVTTRFYAAEYESNDWGPDFPQDRTWRKEEKCFELKQPLSTAMIIDGCHMCRSADGKASMVIDMRTTGLIPDFHGRFQTILHASVGGKGRCRKTILANVQLKIRDKQTSTTETMSAELPTYPPKQHIASSSQQQQRETNVLTERKLLQIADRLADKTNIRRLALNLNVAGHVINTIFVDHSDSITNIADKILCTWFRAQDNPEEALRTLAEALRDCGLNMIARQILDYPPIDGTKRRADEDDGSESKKSKTV